MKGMLIGKKDPDAGSWTVVVMQSECYCCAKGGNLRGAARFP